MASRKRFFTRHPIVLGVRVRVPDDWQEMVTVDVSRRGLFLRTKEPIPLGRIAQMQIDLPGGYKIEAMGHVRRSLTEASESGIGPGMGIEFFVMSREAQDAWDRFVIAEKRRGALQLEETDEIPASPAGVPSAIPEEIIRLSGMPPDMNAGSSEPFPEEAAEQASATVDADGAVKAVKAWDEVEAAELAAPDADEGAGGGAPADVDEAPAFRARATMNVKRPGIEDLAKATSIGAADVSPELRKVIEAARDSASATAAEDVAFITVQPSDNRRLSEFIDRRLRGSNVFLRTSVTCTVGQKVDVTMVHPETDAEFIVTGIVKRVIDVNGTPQGVLLGFGDTDSIERARLQRFVVTGEPDDVDSDDDLALTALIDAAEAAPRDTAAQIALAWGHLRLAESADDAVEQFLVVLALDSANPDVHHGLSVAYELAGEPIKSYAFVRSSWALRGSSGQ